MQTFFSPNTKVTGCVGNFSFNSKEGSLYITLVKQTGWNAESRNGVFKGGAKLTVKFNRGEIGGFINAIRTRGEYSFYHNFGNPPTTGSLKHYVQESEKGKRTGFVLNVNNGEKKYTLGLSTGEAEALMEYLRFALDHIFSADYSADKKAFEDRQKSKGKVAPVSKENNDDEEEVDMGPFKNEEKEDELAAEANVDDEFNWVD